MEPRLHRLVRRKKSNGRGFGPSDFDKFDRYSACGGHGQFGQVNVSTQIDFKESQWGLIGPNTPGAIIHMRINFHQPEKCKLETATITVTLESLNEIHDQEELDALERRPMLQQRPKRSSSTPPRVYFTHLGPTYVPGKETETNFSRNINGTPSISGGPASVSGIGIDRQKNYKYHNRWVFSGQLLGNDTYNGFRSLQWVLQENKFDSPSNHKPGFEAAFALVHQGHSPFFIRIEIKGKLEKKLYRVRHKFQKLKYGFWGEKPLRSTLIAVDLAGIELPKRQLERKAENLPEKMAKRNGIIEVVPERETKITDEDSESDGDGNGNGTNSEYATTSEDLTLISEAKRAHASLSTSQNRTFAGDDHDESVVDYEEREPGKKKESDNIDNINLLLLFRFILRYLFIRAGYVTSKFSTANERSLRDS
ncbi:hypothetical protein ABKA04_006467 [Annulohypoxylon sp. FPYF3050]